MNPLLRVRGVTKSFGGAAALKGVDLDLYPGEIHALMGMNGAGKSTLVQILSGVHQADAGTIEVDGRPHTALAGGLPERCEAEAVLGEQAVPYGHRQPARLSGVQASQVVRAARQGQQAKSQVPVFDGIRLAEGPACALGKTQSFAEIRIVDALAATGQLGLTRFRLGTLFQLLQAKHASGQVTGPCDEDAQPPLGQPLLDGVQRQYFRSPARREDKVKLVGSGPKCVQRMDVIEGDRAPVEDRGVIEDTRPDDARLPSRTAVRFGQIRRRGGWTARKAAHRAQ